MAPNNINVRVSTIDSVITFKVSSKIKPQGLFDQIALTLGLRETWYFGLRHKIPNTDSYRWVDMNKKLLKQGIKIEAPDKMDLEFRFKYYPENVDKDLIQYVTIKLFYLQLKHDILEGVTYCPAETSVVLASYALQIQDGDYDPSVHVPGSFSSIRLLPMEVIQKHNVSDEEWDEKIIEFYKTHQGIDREDGMIEYCKVVEGLDAYGITYFPITNSKGTNMLLGVNTLGINIYETNDKLNPKFSFPWTEIQKLKKSSGSFKVKLTKIDFVAKSPHSKEIFDLCSGTHEMYNRIRKPETLEVQQMRSQRTEEKNVRQIEREKIQKEIKLRKAIEEERRRVIDEVNELNNKNQEIESQLIEARIKIEELEALLRETETDKKQLEIELGRLQVLLEEHSNCQGNDRTLTTQIQQQEQEVKKLQEIIEIKEDQTKCLEEEILHLQGREAVMNGGRRSSSSSSSSSKNEEDVPKEIERIAKEEMESHRIQIKIDEYHDDVKEVEKEIEENCKDIIEAISDETPTKAHEEEVVVNFSSTNQSAENKMIELNKSTLMRELKNRLDETKNVQFETIEDKIHRENLRKGRQKFITLREIRFGTIKRKIEQFEAL